MSLTFAVELIGPAWEKLSELTAAHAASTTSYRRSEPFAPSRQRYQSLNESGFLHFLTARDHGELVGYLILYLTNSMHSQLPMAVEDVFYLHPDYRKGRNALRFIQFMERYCQSKGVHELLFSCEIENESGIKGLLSFLDYREVIVQYSKHLDPPCADSAHSDPMEASHVCALTAPRT